MGKDSSAKPPEASGDGSEADSLLVELARAPETRPPSWRLGTMVGRYRLDAVLGYGGMGVVYRAHDTRLGRVVALKLVREELLAEPSRKARLLREARAAAALTHPNVVATYDAGEDGGQTYLAMELVEGETLRARLANGALPVAEAVEIAKAIAAALAEAHSRKILHRDLKPDNVMLAAGGGVKVLDFGLAKSLSSEDGPVGDAPTVTAEGVVAGTPAYMSPEQLESRELDARSDVFAFGVVLYEMLAGARPFAGDTHNVVVAAILRDEPRPLREAREEVTRALAQLVESCLAKRSERRPESGSELLTRLENLSEENDTGAKPTKRSLPRRWISAGLLLTASAVGALVWTFRAREPATTSPTVHPTPQAAVDDLAALRELRWATLATEASALDGRAIAALRGAGENPGWSVSGDGETVAWTDPDAKAVYVAKLDGTERTSMPLSERTPYDVFFAGNTLYAQLSMAAAPSQPETAGLYRLEQGGAFLLRDRVESFTVDRTNARALLLRTNDGASQQLLESIDLVSGEIRDLGLVAGAADVGLSIALTPGGRTAVIAQYSQNSWRLTRVDVDSGDRRELFASSRLGVITSPGIALTRTHLLFVLGDVRDAKTGASSGSSLWTVPLDDSALPRQVARLPGGLLILNSILDDEGRISATRSTELAASRVGELRAGGTVLADLRAIMPGSPAPTYASGWKDDETLFMMSDTELFSQRADGSEAKLLGRWESGLSQTTLEAGGASLLGVRVNTPQGEDARTGALDLIRITLPGERNRLAQLPIFGRYESDWHHPVVVRCAQVQSTCLIFQNQGRVLVWFDAEGREVAKWEPQLGFSGFQRGAITLAPDGAHFLAMDSGNGIWRLEAANGQARKLETGDLTPALIPQRFSFLPEDGAFLATSMLPHNSIWRVGRDGRAVRLLSQRAWIGNLNVSPNGKRLAFWQREFHEEPWIYDLPKP